MKFSTSVESTAPECVYVCPIFCKSWVALPACQLVKNMCLGFFLVHQGNIWGRFFHFSKKAIFGHFTGGQNVKKIPFFEKFLKKNFLVRIIQFAKKSKMRIFFIFLPKSGHLGPRLRKFFKIFFLIFFCSESFNSQKKVK